MEKTLQNFITEFKTELDTVFGIYKEFKFNTSRLPDVHQFTHKEDIRQHPAFKTLFDELQKIKSHSLYWLSAETVEEANELKARINHNKKELFSEDKTKCRILPALNKNENSTTIYVGVRKGSNTKAQTISNIAGRMVQHLGYYAVGTTQGLQLSYYTRDLNINMTLHVYSLNNCPDEYLYILEKIFAKKLKPICGSH